MPASNPTTTRIHAPWTKKILIPLWIVQFGFVLVEFGWSVTMLGIAVQGGSDSGVSRFGLITEGVNVPLHAILCIIIIYTFVKFSRFQLTTSMYQKQCFFAVVVGVVGTALGFSGSGVNEDFSQNGDPMSGIWCAVHLLASLVLMGYAIVVGRAVLKGHKFEMNDFSRETLVPGERNSECNAVEV